MVKLLAQELIQRWSRFLLTPVPFIFVFFLEFPSLMTLGDYRDL